jgi:hypothetical protein
MTERDQAYTVETMLDSTPQLKDGIMINGLEVNAPQNQPRSQFARQRKRKIEKLWTGRNLGPKSLFRVGDRNEQRPSSWR